MVILVKDSFQVCGHQYENFKNLQQMLGVVGPQRVIWEALRIPEIFLGYPLDQTYFHNNIKMLFIL